RLPMSAARGCGECRRRRKNLRAVCTHLPKELGKTDVITDGEAEATDRRVDDHGIAPGAHAGGLAMTFRPAWHIDVEEMDLVVPGHAFAVRGKYQRRRRDAALAVDTDRHRARDDPKRKRTCGIRQ